MKNQTLIIIVTVLIMLFCVRFFPAADPFQDILANLVFFVLLPISVIKFVLKAPFSQYGLSLRLRKKDFLWGGAALAVALAGFFAAYWYTILGQFYYPSLIVSQSFFLYCLYTVFLNGLIALCFTVFFYGFFLHGLKRIVSMWSIPAAILLFAATLASLNAFTWDSSVAIFFSVFAVALSYRTGNALVVFLSSWMFAIIVDTILLRLF